VFFWHHYTNQLHSFSVDLFEREKVQEENSGFYIPVSIVDSRWDNYANYVDFATFFIAPIVGKIQFEYCCYRQSFSEYVTKSDEALALLIYQNNFDRWLSMARANNWASSTIRPKYTTGGNASQTPKKKGKKSTKEKQEACNVEGQGVFNTPTSARCQGWSVDGIKRFNELFDAIEKERVSPIGRVFDNDFLQYSVIERENTRKKQKHETNVFETCRHELWDEDELAPNGSQCIDSANFESGEDIIVKKEYGSEEDSDIAGMLFHEV
jgi:hypothetical protein